MPKQKQGESVSQFAIRTAWELGHFWSPSNPEGQALSQSDLASLTVSDDVVVKALISLSKSSVDRDGKIREFAGPSSPEMQVILEESRCPVPDFAPPPGVSFLFEDKDLQQIALKMQRDAQEAVAGGGWANCHGGNNIHQMAIRVNPAGMNPRVVPLWPQIMRNTQKKYAMLGLLIRFIGMDDKDLLTGEKWTSTINSDLTFVQSSPGWIGLAILGSNEVCSSRIWLKLLAPYTGGTTDEVIIRQVGAVLAHEIGHNVYLNHTAGFLMNSSIVNDNPVDNWLPGDPSKIKLISLYTGVPVPIPGGTPPGPPSTLEQRVHALEVQNAVNKVTLDWCVTKIHELGG